MNQPESQDTTAALRELLTPVVEGEGLFLEEINVIGAGANRIVQVLVDLPEESTEGVELDDIARVSRAVSDALDESDAVDGPAYELEVSSPGATRELKALRHWKRSVGRHVSVTPVNTSEQPKFTARLLSVQDAEGDDDATVTLQRSEQVKKGMPVKLLDPETWPLGSIRRAKVQVQD
ncbi:ribosome maturation factor RimP [Kocuria sp. JC486]|uniref:ribosome maturation factor RimP n=1 Tax=Kocuria sp. JC486 TaxID=1970736 RepID=UPI0014245BBB|nr:ribosome maturation factor RimP [Kocuria sp. JC486]